eukprot:12802-Pelagomonas_calceolata.AAC.7
MEDEHEDESKSMDACMGRWRFDRRTVPTWHHQQINFHKGAGMIADVSLFEHAGICQRGVTILWTL